MLGPLEEPDATSALKSAPDERWVKSDLELFCQTLLMYCCWYEKVETSDIIIVPVMFNLLFGNFFALGPLSTACKNIQPDW